MNSFNFITYDYFYYLKVFRSESKITEQKDHIYKKRNEYKMRIN